MKALSRKCTAFLLSLTLLLTLAPTALASEALGDDLDLRSTTLNHGAELGEGTFWSNTFSDLRQENYVVYTPNTSVTPIVTYGDYTTATSTVSAAAKRLEEQGLRVVAGINGDYYDTLNGAPLGTVMTDGVLRVASASNYAVGFRADGTAILGAPALAMQVESANTSFSIAAVNQVRYSYGGIYLYTYDFNARRSTGTNAAGYDVVCSAVDGRLSIGETLTLTVDEILPEATDTAVSEGKYVLTANLLSGEENLALLRALAVGDTLTVTVRAADEGWNDVDYMIGALYQLVDNGQVCSGLVNGAAPRTAVGLKRDGSLVLYTIDGRQSGYSIGATLTQVAERMGYYIEGRTNGSAAMKSVLRGGEITADILLDSVEVNDIPAPPMRLASRWDFARSRAGVTVSDRIRRDTLIRGFYAPDRNRYFARLDVDSLDMALLDPILAGVVSSTEGMASAGLTLQGQGRKADLEGEIRVAGLKTTVDFTQVTYSMPEAVLNVKNNRFRASNVPIFDPRGNRGRFDFDMNLQHLSNISYDVRVAPQQMLVLDTDSDDNDMFYGRVFATGTARISGDKGAVNMDITASTDGNSSFVMPLSSKSNISNADFVVFEQPEQADTLDDVARKKLSFERKHRQKSDAGSQMKITLALDVRPDAEVELEVAGNTVKGRGAGALNLQINPKANIFEIYGDYTIAEGSFMLSLQQIINKRFTIESGSSIQWTGSPMNAMLDIDAVYKVKASLQPLLQGTADLGGDRSVPVECVIHLGERLSNPTITFDVRVPGSDPETQSLIANALSTPETVDTQFLYLLLFNSFMSENSSQASSNIGSSVSAATGLEFVSNMVSNWLSSSDYNVVIRYRPKSELTSDEVDFGLSKSLINNRLFVEVEGNYLIDNKQAVNSSMSNFMGEAYITYLIDRAGTLKLKAFTQTIDRFDENQGLQETGIGVYFKEDFDNLRDLRQRIKERFTNKKRKARRIARRTARAAEKAAEDADRSRLREPADTLSPFGYVKEEEDE